MDLFTIQNTLIAGSSVDDWFRIGAAGTLFDYQWSFGTGPEGNWSHVIGEHSRHAVYRAEPSLTLSWGMDADDPSDTYDRRHYDWARTS